MNALTQEAFQINDKGFASPDSDANDIARQLRYKLTVPSLSVPKDWSSKSGFLISHSRRMFGNL